MDPMGTNPTSHIWVKPFIIPNSWLLTKVYINFIPGHQRAVTKTLMCCGSTRVDRQITPTCLEFVEALSRSYRIFRCLRITGNISYHSRRLSSKTILGWFQWQCALANSQFLGRSWRLCYTRYSQFAVTGSTKSALFLRMRRMYSMWLNGLVMDPI